MSKKFDPDKPYVKIRGMGTVNFEQDGHRFTSGHVHIGPIKQVDKPDKPAPEKKEDVRARARAKINKKKGKGSLKDFRENESPDAVSSAVKENAAAKAAEEHVA